MAENVDKDHSVLSLQNIKFNLKYISVNET